MQKNLRMRFATGSISTALVSAFIALPVSASDNPEPKLSAAQVRLDAEHCARILDVLGSAQRALFPDGLEKAEATDLTGGGIPWPPPATYSWRVAVLPSIEQTPLYAKLFKASDEFKIPAGVTAADLKKLPDLQQVFQAMPRLLTLPSTKVPDGRTVFRRIKAPAKPSLFIVVESSETVPWYAPESDLQLDDKKPRPRMGGNFPGGFFALCGDEKVRFIPDNLTDKQIREALLTGAGVLPLRTEDDDKLKKDIETLKFALPPKK